MRLTALTLAIMAFLCLPAWSQVVEELEHRDMLDLEKFVLMLKSGEQIVIRGDFQVKGDRTYFYYENGRYPVYALMKTKYIDLQATERANEKLRKERIRRDNYYRLIEETRRKTLEEDLTGPFIVESADSSVMPDPEFRDDLRQSTFYIQEARNFPPYVEEDLEYQPELWWRTESDKLFAALELHNNRMVELSNDHNTIARQIRNAKSRDEELHLRQQLQQFRDAMQTERNLGRLIGNRLVELSEYAQKLEIPMDWIIPDNSPAYEEDELSNQN